MFYDPELKNLNDVSDINWRGGKPPLNQPRCDFDGNNPACFGELFVTVISLEVQQSDLVSFVRATTQPPIDCSGCSVRRDRGSRSCYPHNMVRTKNLGKPQGREVAE